MFISNCADVPDRVSTLVENKIRVEPNRYSILSGWLNRNNGFERLEQSSDGENEFVNNDL